LSCKGLNYLDELLDFLHPYSSSLEICFYLNLTNIENNVEQLNKILKMDNIKIIFCLTSTEINNLHKILQYIPKETVEIHCLIETDEDMNIFDTILAKQSVKHILFPIYNGDNHDFFRNNVFITTSDIDATFLDMNQIFKNQTLNSFYFGHLILLPNGNVHTNLNTEKIGNVYQKALIEMIYQVLKNKTGDWFLTRSKVSPCNKCIYNFLCPAPSNYDFILKCNNLCNIHVEK
jgi:pseudo-rSAM protein